MKTSRFVVSLLGAVALALPVAAQNVQFNSGSSGIHGAFAPTVNTNVTLPPDGRLHYTTVSIPSSVTVTFTRNAANTPVYLLSQGAIDIQGFIQVNGERGTALRGGFGGPGGFDGGMAGIGGSTPGDGHGPGGGRGSLDVNLVGRGVYGTNFATPRLNDGSQYGSQLLMPLVGGSGGGGLPNSGGGGGGGAILIASSVAITNRGSVSAQGGLGFSPIVAWGSGGAIRLLAPVIAGTGTLDVSGPIGNVNAGRIRCDLIERQSFGLSFSPFTARITANETFMVSFPPNLPTLRLLRVAGTDVPANAPAGFTVTLPFNAPASQQVVVEASGFGARVLASLRLSPAVNPASPPIEFEIPNDVADPATFTVTTDFPPNVPVTVEAWTR